MGVDLFFVISGFVIGLSAFAEIDKRGAWNFQGAFFVIDDFRIFREDANWV